MNEMQPNFRELAERHDLPVQSLKDRWLEGARGDELLQGHVRLPVTDEWVSTPQAADILHIAVSTLHQIGRLDGIRRHSRSTAGGQSRGAGCVWYRPDVERVATLRREAKIGLHGAIRVMVTLRNSKLGEPSCA